MRGLGSLPLTGRTRWAQILRLLQGNQRGNQFALAILGDP